MTEAVETQVESVDTPVETTPQETQYSEVETKAMAQGWRPKDEWEGEPDKWRDAKEFVERGELFDKMDTINRDLKETRKALKMLQDHHAKLKETEYKRAVDELKAAQRKHLEDGDSGAYLEVTETLTELKAEQKAREVIQQTQANQPDPRFVQWVNDNKWYNSDTSMRAFADTLGQTYARQNPGIDPVEVLEYVTTEVKLRYKEKFENPNRRKPSAVEGGGTQTTGAKTVAFDLSDEERKVMNTFVRQGVMTKEAFIDEVKKMRGIK